MNKNKDKSFSGEEVHLKVIRQRTGGLPDQGPWVATWKEGGEPASPEFSVFDELFEEVRALVRKENCTVSLYNKFNQHLITVCPEKVDHDNLYDAALMLGGIPLKRAVDARPVCPNCGEKARLEPAHYTDKKSPTGQWRWNCQDCDFAVSTVTDQRFHPTGRLASRGERSLRAEVHKSLSNLWTSRAYSKREVYDALNDHFGSNKDNRVNVAKMTTPQLLETLAIVNQATSASADGLSRYKGSTSFADATRRSTLAKNELKQLYNAITHDPGEPTYLGDGVYLHPNGELE